MKLHGIFNIINYYKLRVMIQPYIWAIKAGKCLRFMHAPRTEQQSPSAQSQGWQLRCQVNWTATGTHCESNYNVNTCKKLVPICSRHPLHLTPTKIAQSYANTTATYIVLRSLTASLLHFYIMTSLVGDVIYIITWREGSGLATWDHRYSTLNRISIVIP